MSLAEHLTRCQRKIEVGSTVMARSYLSRIPTWTQAEVVAFSADGRLAHLRGLHGNEFGRVTAGLELDHADCMAAESCVRCGADRDPADEGDLCEHCAASDLRDDLRAGAL